MKRARQIRLAKPAPWKRERLASSIRRWKSIALTWRKTSRSTRSHIASPGGAVARYNWSPRFNLNLHLAFTVHALPSRTGARSATASPIPGRQPYAQFTSLHMLARSSLTMETRRLVSHMLRDVVTRERTNRPPGQAETSKLFRAYTTETRRLISHRLRDIVTRERTNRAPGHAEVSKLFRAYTLSTPARSIRPTTVSSAGPGRIHTCAAKETTSLTQLSRTTWWSRHRTGRLAWITQAELVFEPSRPSKTAAAFRVPELVWRVESQSKMLAAIERGIGVATPAVAPPDAVRTPQFEQSPSPFGLSPAQTLDPALIDRVADDVIGRVERRIRIERERRGV